MAEQKPNARTRAQRFTFTEVLRSQINPAPYNPRSIEDYARNLLRKSLKEFGVVEPVVWNKRTGSLIGGHQRLYLLDEANKFPANDYSLGVSQVDLDLKKEKQLNVWLNNKSAQGSFERDSFFDMLRSGIQAEDVGLTFTDLKDEFGDLPDDLFLNVTASENPVEPKPKKKSKPVEPDPDDFVLVCFASGDEKGAWLKAHHMPEGIKTMAIEEMLTVERGK